MVERQRERQRDRILIGGKTERDRKREYYLTFGNNLTTGLLLLFWILFNLLNKNHLI